MVILLKTGHQAGRSTQLGASVTQSEPHSRLDYLVPGRLNGSNKEDILAYTKPS